jgi:hypothetical protein
LVTCLEALDSPAEDDFRVTGLILKRGKLTRSSGQWQDEDYDVLADGKVVGRVYEDASASTPPELRWFWSITVIVPAIPNVTSRPRMFDPVLIKTARPFVNCPGARHRIMVVLRGPLGTLRG